MCEETESETDNVRSEIVKNGTKGEGRFVVVDTVVDTVVMDALVMEAVRI